MAELVGLLDMQNKATRLPASGKSYIEEVRALEYAYTDTGEALILRIPASAEEPVYLVEVLHLVRTAFSGGTPSIDIGDGTTADRWVATAAITEGTAGNLARGAGGAKLVANTQVKVTLSASLAAGAGTVFVRLFRPA